MTEHDAATVIEPARRHPAHAARLRKSGIRGFAAQADIRMVRLRV